MPDFRAKIDEQELSIIKRGLDCVRHEATDPRKPDYELVKVIKDLVKKIDVMATKYSKYKRDIENAIIRDELENPVITSDDES